MPDENRTQHRGEQQQQREQRDEGVVRDQRREVRAGVVDVLVDDRDREPGSAMALLPVVEPFDRAHTGGCPGESGSYPPPVTTWIPARLGSAAYAIRTPPAAAARSASSASAV